MYKFNKRFVC